MSAPSSDALPPLSAAEFHALPFLPTAYASRFLHDTRALVARVAARSAEGILDGALAMRAARRVVRR